MNTDSRKGVEMDRKIFGELGEKFAAGLLEADGYSVLDRNYRCKF